MKRKLFFSVGILFCLLFSIYFFSSFRVEGEQIIELSNVENSYGKIKNKKKGFHFQKADESPVKKITKIYKINSLEEYDNISKYGPLPDCLQGTLFIINLSVDKNGDLIISEDIRHLIEYFLTAQLEENRDTVIGRIEEFFNLTLPPDAAMEAYDILHSYLAYKKALTGFDTEAYDGEDNSSLIGGLKIAAAKRFDARRKYLGEEVVEAFFAREEAYDSFTLKRMEIENDDSLDFKKKATLLEEEEEFLPESMKERRQKWRDEQVLRVEIEQLKAAGDNSDKIFKLRSDLYGEKGALALANIDKKRDELKSRFKEYSFDKQKILNSKDITDEEKELNIDEIKRSYFSSKEIIKIGIWESIENNKKS